MGVFPLDPVRVRRLCDAADWYEVPWYKYAQTFSYLRILMELLAQPQRLHQMKIPQGGFIPMKLISTVVAVAAAATLVVPAFAQMSTMHKGMMKKPMMHGKMSKKQMMMHKKMMHKGGMMHSGTMKSGMMHKGGMMHSGTMKKTM